MENNPTNENLFNVSIDEDSIAHLRKAATWAKIIAIVGFANILVTCIEFFRRSGSDFANMTAYQKGALVGGFLFLAVFLAILVILNLFMLRFSNSTKAGIDNSNQLQFNSGIGNLHSYFKMLGILVIVGLGICVLVFFFAVLGGAMR